MHDVAVHGFKYRLAVAMNAPVIGAPNATTERFVLEWVARFCEDKARRMAGMSELPTPRPGDVDFRS